MYEASGTIKKIFDTQTFPSGFTKREFVLTTSSDRYPQDLKFEVVKDKCSMLDDFEPDQEVVVSFDIRGNEYQGKYFVNLSCWKIQTIDGNGSGTTSSRTTSSSASASNQARSGRAEFTSSKRSFPPNEARLDEEPSLEDLRNENDFDDDDIPF